MLETKRLLLRQWKYSDAKDLYEYAKDPLVGLSAGWEPHKSVEYSRKLIKSAEFETETYAVVLKESKKIIGSVGMVLGKASNLGLLDNEGEVGCWVGVPFWGMGIMPEAVNELIRHGFEDLGLSKIWCAYFDGNEKSKRVQDKCGFVYHHTNENVECFLLKKRITEHVACLGKETWLSNLNH